MGKHKFKIKFPKGDFVNNAGKDKKGINPSIKILLSLIIFAIILFSGLVVLDNSFNNMVGMNQEESIFAFEQKSQDLYDVIFMGESKEVNTKTIRLIFEEYGGAIESWSAESKGITLEVFDKIASWCSIK